MTDSSTSGNSDVLRSMSMPPLRDALPRLLDALSDAVAIVDPSGRIHAANARFRDAFGLEGPSLMGLTCPRVEHCEHPGHPGEESCIACDVATTGASRRALHVVADATGVQRRWEVVMNPLHDDLGKVAMVVEVWRDVTDRSQLEAQLSHSERLASLGLLAAGVAHEVNNPLASLLAGVETLQRWLTRAPLSPDARMEAEEVLGLLEKETQRCRETTDKLLLLAQPYSTRPVRVDLERAIDDTTSLLQHACRRQGVAIALDVERPLPALWGQESALRGVLMNLCMNAVQAMPTGGTLTLRARRGGEWALIDVEDTGPGIAPDHLDRIWDPFFTTKPVGQGTGLGLSITRRVIEHHGGWIRVNNKPGEGARFHFQLPLEGPGGERA